MSERDLSYAAWRLRRARGATRRARLNALLPPYYRNYRHYRQRLRSDAEARFLRRIGTPERLIGPVGSEEKVAEERAELIEFARRLRRAAGRG